MCAHHNYRTRSSCDSLIKEKSEEAECKENKRDPTWIACQDINWGTSINDADTQKLAGLLKKELEKRLVDVSQFAAAWASLTKT
jgi:hypothetical protein